MRVERGRSNATQLGQVGECNMRRWPKRPQSYRVGADANPLQSVLHASRETVAQQIVAGVAAEDEVLAVGRSRQTFELGNRPASVHVDVVRQIRLKTKSGTPTGWRAALPTE